MPNDEELTTIHPEIMIVITPPAEQENATHSRNKKTNNIQNAERNQETRISRTNTTVEGETLKQIQETRHKEIQRQIMHMAIWMGKMPQ